MYANRMNASCTLAVCFLHSASLHQLKGCSNGVPVHTACTVPLLPFSSPGLTFVHLSGCCCKECRGWRRALYQTRCTTTSMHTPCIDIGIGCAPSRARSSAFCRLHVPKGLRTQASACTYVPISAVGRGLDANHSVRCSEITFWLVAQ